MLKYLSIVFLGICSSLSAFAETVQKSYPIKSINKIVASNTSGEIRVEPSKDQKTSLLVNKLSWGKDCMLTIDSAGGKLFVEVTGGSGWTNQPNCRSDIKILSGIDNQITANAGSGDIHVTGISGAINAEVGSGTVRILETSSSDLSAKTGSGDIFISGTLQKLDLKTGSGDVDISYRKPPTTGTTNVQTGSGDVKVALPKNSQVKVQHQAGSGRMSSDIPLHPKGYLIEVKSGSGNLHLKELSQIKG